MATRRQNGPSREHVPRNLGRGFDPGDADPWYGPGYEEHVMDRVTVHGPRYRQSLPTAPFTGGTEDIEWERYDRERRAALSGPHRGRGPKGYRRSDERIHDDICRLFTDDPDLDASDITVDVRDAEVYLTGTVATRRQKRLAEDIADVVTGVVDIHNHLTLYRP